MEIRRGGFVAWEISSLFNWKDFTSCLLIYREIRVIDRPPFSRGFFSRNKFIIPNLILKIFNQIREISIGVDNKKERLENDIYIYVHPQIESSIISPNRSMHSMHKANFHLIKTNITTVTSNIRFTNRPIDPKLSPEWITSRMPTDAVKSKRRVHVGDTCF